MKQLSGIIASKGVAIGNALVFKKYDININKITLKNSDEIACEIDIFKKAISKSIVQIKKLIEECEEKNQKEILTAHLGMVEDYEIIREVEQKIQDEKVCCEYEYKEVIDNYIDMFTNIDDEYLAARAEDLKDIYTRVMHNIKDIPIIGLDNLPENTIIVSHDLTPSDTIKINFSNLNGIITETGSKTSHTSIIANNFGIPAMLSCVDAMNEIKDNDVVIIDANNGNIVVRPNNDILLKYQNIVQREKDYQFQLEELKQLETRTNCGVKIDLCANAGSVEEAKLGFDKNAKGLGLFRTEFIYMNNNKFPTEEEQFTVYKNLALLSQDDKYTAIRTLDIGGDKKLPYYNFAHEDNPFLGLRGIRFLMERIDIFRVQLKAILRASAFGNLYIMLPMVISVDEILKAKKIIEEIKQELLAENIDFDNNIQVGIMIETPASVMIADELTKHCDFFSIGTNDLTQYILSVDRGNNKIESLYNTYNPAVLRCIKVVIEIAQKNDIWCGMCGEFAGDFKAIQLLLGMGLKEFSVSSNKLFKVKEIILNSNLEECKKLAEEVLKLYNLEDVLEKIEDVYNQYNNV